jgi:hypothetical protein
VRLAAARRPDAPAGVLLALVRETGDEGHRGPRLTDHPNFPRPSLREFADDPRPAFPSLALRDPDLPAEVLRRLAADPELADRQGSVARHPNRVLAVFAGVLAPFALVAAASVNIFEGFDEDSPSHRVAVAPDGRPALYARRGYDSGSETCYRLRTTGRLVRESRVDVACVTDVQVGFADAGHLRIGTRTIAFSRLAATEIVYN